MYGEMADMLYKSQNVIPKRLLAHHFTFCYPDIDTAVQQLLQ